MNTKPHPNDPVPVWLLNSCKEYLFPILLYIANRSLKESVFPDQLKHAVVRPIIKDKNGNKDEYKNYRPVSNLTFLSKLIEKCANSQLQAYLQTNNLYPKYQSAYRKGHSCETALLKVANDIQKEISSRNMVAMMLLDLSSAFDTISLFETFPYLTRNGSHNPFQGSMTVSMLPLMGGRGGQPIFVFCIFDFINVTLYLHFSPKIPL